MRQRPQEYQAPPEDLRGGAQALREESVDSLLAQSCLRGTSCPSHRPRPALGPCPPHRPELAPLHTPNLARGTVPLLALSVVQFGLHGQTGLLAKQPRPRKSRKFHSLLPAWQNLKPAVIAHALFQDVRSKQPCRPLMPTSSIHLGLVCRPKQLLAATFRQRHSDKRRVNREWAQD